MFGNWLLGAICAMAALAALSGTACTKPLDIHDTPEAKGQPCIGCHRAAFGSAVNPKHVGVMPETCNTCHTTKGWAPATVSAKDHPWFSLANKHAPPTACAACHTKGYQQGDTPKACVGCHQKDYDGTQNPAHKGAGFSTDCAGCHSDAGWRPAVSTSVTNHSWWPLNGKHGSAQCLGCHVGNPAVYKGTPRDCASCHKKDYDGATTPVHAALPTTCNTCHTEAGWQPSTFSHPWKLDGKHTSTPCASCHTGSPPRWAGTPTTCGNCHQTDFQTAAAKVPGHNTYPQTCENCHTTSGWTGASGGTHPEASFPLTNTIHGAGIVCTDCHIASLGSPVKGANTDCIHCHLGAHGRAAMDSNPKHAIAGYPGASAPPNFCLSCHATGKL